MPPSSSVSTKAGLGGGLGPIITASMVLVLPVGVALGVQLPMLLVGDVFSVAAFWKHWSFLHARRLLLGAVPGVLLGTFLLASIDATLIQRLIGLVALSFVIYRFAQNRLKRIALLTGFTNIDLQIRLLPTLVFLPLGVLSGRWIVTRISPVVFDRVILTILTITGFFLLLGF